uniref:Uncharacterized protein n=1 Tax=Geospiza parvula TaxID=87175 RepID=A0A8U8B9W8_GEOPR
MAHITINQYLQQVQEAIETRDGTFCAELVSFKHPHVANPRLQVRMCFLTFCFTFSFPSSMCGFLSIGEKPQKSVSQAEVGSPCRFASLFTRTLYIIFVFWLALCVPF